MCERTLEQPFQYRGDLETSKLWPIRLQQSGSVEVPKRSKLFTARISYCPVGEPSSRHFFRAARPKHGSGRKLAQHAPHLGILKACTQPPLELPIATVVHDWRDTRSLPHTRHIERVPQESAVRHDDNLALRPLSEPRKRLPGTERQRRQIGRFAVPVERLLAAVAAFVRRPELIMLVQAALGDVDDDAPLGSHIGHYGAERAACITKVVDCLAHRLESNQWHADLQLRREAERGRLRRTGLPRAANVLSKRCDEQRASVRWLVSYEWRGDDDIRADATDCPCQLRALPPALFCQRRVKAGRRPHGVGLHIVNALLNETAGNEKKLTIRDLVHLLRPWAGGYERVRGPSDVIQGSCTAWARQHLSVSHEVQNLGAVVWSSVGADGAAPTCHARAA